MKRIILLLLACFASFGCGLELSAATNSVATPTAAAVTPAPPPAGPAQRSAADLEKLVAPIALYPDPLIATMLPASVYPLEVVQAARFVADTNNLAKLDEQPWDDSVKAVARVPDAIKKLNDDLAWTIELGDAFLAQDKDVMDAIQSMRAKAQKAGTLQTTTQQVVVVTNVIVEKTVEQKVVVVTNTVVQIQPSSSSVVYVPTYNPYTVYYPPPAYVYNPYAPLVTFTAGVAMGAILANNCDWYHGGCYHGDVDIDIDRNVNRNTDRNVNRNQNANRSAQASSQKKWQPDQSRLNKSGASASTANREARGWSGGAGASTQPAQRPATAAGAARPAQQPGAGTQPARAPGAGQPSTPAQRPASPTAGSKPTTTWQQPSAARPAPPPSASARPAQSPSAGARPAPSPSVSRPSAQPSSAFGGASSGSNARSASNRGAASRGGGGGGGGGRGRGR